MGKRKQQIDPNEYDLPTVIAQHVGVSHPTVFRAIKLGHLPHIVLRSGAKLVSYKEAEKWERNRRPAGRPFNEDRE